MKMRAVWYISRRSTRRYVPETSHLQIRFYFLLGLLNFDLFRVGPVHHQENATTVYDLVPTASS
jgi:hypothetical protein